VSTPSKAKPRSRPLTAKCMRPTRKSSMQATKSPTKPTGRCNDQVWVIAGAQRWRAPGAHLDRRHSRTPAVARPPRRRSGRHPRARADFAVYQRHTNANRRRHHSRPPAKSEQPRCTTPPGHTHTHTPQGNPSSPPPPIPTRRATGPHRTRQLAVWRSPVPGQPSGFESQSSKHGGRWLLLLAQPSQRTSCRCAPSRGSGETIRVGKFQPTTRLLTVPEARE
jgi:hypothetical protein